MREVKDPSCVVLKRLCRLVVLGEERDVGCSSMRGQHVRRRLRLLVFVVH